MNGTPTFRELANDKGLLIGAAVDEHSFDDLDYQRFLIKHFNCLYPSWALKWDCLHCEQGKFDFSLSDRIVNFALENGCKVRLNCLLWHNDIPKWFVDLDPKQETAREIVEEHIDKVLSHFEGRIEFCDVVNEAIGDNGKPRPNGFSQYLGEGWIEWAYRLARKAAPSMSLFYCDYRIKADAKWETIYTMAEGLIKAGTPIDGLAVQLHSRLVPALSQGQITHHLSKLAPLKLKLHLPECGVWIPPYIGPEGLQGSIYGGMVKAGMLAGAAQIGFWWPTDWRLRAKRWLDFNGDVARPGLYGKSREEKPAAIQVRKALAQTPYPPPAI